MTGDAGRGLVFASQVVFGFFIMIKLDGLPAFLNVTTLAFFGEFSHAFAVWTLLTMAAITIRFSLAVFFLRLMTALTRNGGMTISERIIGLFVIKGLWIKFNDIGIPALVIRVTGTATRIGARF